MGASTKGVVPQKRMVYMGISYENGWFRGTPMNGNPHIVPQQPVYTVWKKPFGPSDMELPFSLHVALSMIPGRRAEDHPTNSNCLATILKTCFQAMCKWENPTNQELTRLHSHLRAYPVLGT